MSVTRWEMEDWQAVAHHAMQEREYLLIKRLQQIAAMLPVEGQEHVDYVANDIELPENWRQL